MSLLFLVIFCVGQQNRVNNNTALLLCVVGTPCCSCVTCCWYTVLLLCVVGTPCCCVLNCCYTVIFAFCCICLFVVGKQCCCGVVGTLCFCCVVGTLICCF